MNPEIQAHSIRESLSEELNEWRTKLLSGSLKPEEFLEKVLSHDQATPERSGAADNITLLTEGKIVGFFEKSTERSRFYNIRSLTYFHRAQYREHRGEQGVVEDVTYALEDADKAGHEYVDWMRYVQATVLYLKNDVQRLKTLLETTESDYDGNKSLVNNLLLGLEKRGYPDYAADCDRPRKY